MKKLISILLVAMLVIGMFPAIVSAEAVTETITFDANKTQRVSQNSTSQVWKSEHITFTNNKGSSSTNVADYTNPVRLYGKSELVIECDTGKMTSIVFASNGGSDYKASLNSSLTAAGVSFTNSGNNYTVTFADGVESFTFQNTSTKQIRLYSITVTYEASASTEPECEHANTTTTTVEATCTEAGSITVTCDDCGEVVETEELSVIDHNYVNGECTMCKKAEPEGYVLIDITQNGTYKNVVIVATKTGTYAGTYAMSNSNGTDSAPAAVAVTVSNGVLAVEEENLEWDIVNNNGTLTIYPAGETAKWLYCTNTNNGVRVGTNTNKTFTIDTTGYLKHSGTSRYLGVYNAQDWRCYDSPDGVNIKEQTFAFYAPKQAAEETKDYVSDDEIGYDSIEEALKAGSTTLKSTTGAEMPFQVDVTVGNTTTTYIGLEDGDYYSYYELTLKMSSISLRASEAGIYYGAKVVCDDALAQAVDSYGIVLSTNDMPAELEATDNAFTVISGPIDTTKTIRSGSVFNIFDESLEDSVNTTRGTVAIYAAVYLEIDGQVVISKQEISWSLQKVVETINDAVATDELELEGAQLEAIVDFYQKWAVENEVINGWRVSKLEELHAQNGNV